MTDNGAGYRSHSFRALLKNQSIRHIRTKPYTPRTNGKAEAFIRILQREWAYAYIYPSSAHRAQALRGIGDIRAGLAVRFAAGSGDR